MSRTLRFDGTAGGRVYSVSNAVYDAINWNVGGDSKSVFFFDTEDGRSVVYYGSEMYSVLVGGFSPSRTMVAPNYKLIVQAARGSWEILLDQTEKDNLFTLLTVQEENGPPGPPAAKIENMVVEIEATNGNRLIVTNGNITCFEIQPEGFQIPSDPN